MTKTRSEIPATDRWNVEALYETPEVWRKELQKILAEPKAPHWPELKSYQGRLKDPAAAASLFNLYFDLDRRLSKLHVYAHLRYDEDLGNDTFKSDFGLISSLGYDFQLESSWIEPELLALSEADFQRLMGDSSLAAYRFYLERLRRMRAHTLSPELEELLSMSGKALSTASRAFGALNHADMKFAPAIDSKGEEHPLSNGSYLSLLRSPDRALRRSAFQNLHHAYEAHANTFAELLQGQVQNHLYFARARKFSSCLEAALYPNQIDTAVYENLIASIRRYLPLMHSYIALRKKILHLDEIHTYDLQIPLVEEVNVTLPYPEACQTVIDSVAPLGAAYQADLKKGLVEERWVDVYETARKRSGAYSSGCYDSMPYILMNYNGTLNDVRTLAHEAGHSMHSLLSRRHQP